VDNIKIDLGETGWSAMDWIRLAKNRAEWRVLVIAVINFWVS
jgi:hypothetical protein